MALAITPPLQNCTQENWPRTPRAYWPYGWGESPVGTTQNSGSVGTSWLWGCARTVARYMRRPYDGTPSPGWPQFLTQHSDEIWTCDLFTVQTVWFQTLYVFFVIHHGTRELVHARATAHPNSKWMAQQMVEACGILRGPWAKSPVNWASNRLSCNTVAANDKQAVTGPFQSR